MLSIRRFPSFLFFDHLTYLGNISSFSSYLERSIVKQSYLLNTPLTPGLNLFRTFTLPFDIVVSRIIGGFWNNCSLLSAVISSSNRFAFDAISCPKHRRIFRREITRFCVIMYVVRLCVTYYFQRRSLYSQFSFLTSVVHFLSFSDIFDSCQPPW